MFNFEIKRRLVVEDKSKIFTAWKELVPSITKEDFIENLEWLCNDPREYGNGEGRLTREIGLTTKGIVHLTRQNEWLTTFYREDNKELWGGDFFTVKGDEKAVKMGLADKNGMVFVRRKISLSAEDRI